MSVATAQETPLQARLSHVIGRLRPLVCQRKAPGQKDVLGEIVNELTHLYRDIGGVEAVDRPAPSHAPGPRQMGSKRRCPSHHDGRGADVSVSRFRPGKDQCRECERQVTVTKNAVAVTLLEGDRCIGHDCPVCGLPLEIGERVRGVNLAHEACA